MRFQERTEEVSLFCGVSRRVWKGWGRREVVRMERWEGEAYCEYWDEGMVYLGTLVVSVKFWRAAGGRVSRT